MKKVYWIEGDGIGPEIWKVARPVLDAAMAHMSESLEWTELLAGEKALAATGELLPQATLKALENAEVAIKGPPRNTRRRRLSQPERDSASTL